ncbi:MAG: hypothetical protein ACTH8F_06475 [Microbacterium sp.]|uniref:hypothetical protein n=1 Tax=Microbacterium sp. TaxID=51671 RepID=UPI003F949AED
MPALPHETRQRVRLGKTAVIVALVQPAVLLVFLVASLIFTGAQVMRDQSAAYEQLVPFPVFVVPGWFLVAPAGVLVVVIAIYTFAAQMLDAPRIGGLFWPVIASLVAAFFFLLARTTQDDPLLLVCLWLNVASIALLTLAAVRFLPTYDRWSSNHRSRMPTKL